MYEPIGDHDFVSASPAKISDHYFTLEPTSTSVNSPHSSAVSSVGIYETSDNVEQLSQVW